MWLSGQAFSQYDALWPLSLDGDAADELSVDEEIVIGFLRIAHLDGNAAPGEVGLQISSGPVISHASVAQGECSAGIGYALLQPFGVVDLRDGHLKGRREHDQGNKNSFHVVVFGF